MSAALVWLAANCLAVVLLAVVVGAWARSRADVRRRALPGAISLVLGVSLMLVLFRPADIPTGWITVLQEGHSIRNVRQLCGRGAHFGAGFSILTDLLTRSDVTTLAAVVHLNLCLALVNVGLFFLLASAVLPSWWASVAFALGYACNLNTLHAALSELPAMLWTTYFWLGCIAAAVIEDRAHSTLRLRWLALCWLALLAVLAGQLRGELLMVGAPAVALGVAKVLGWETAVWRVARTAGRLLLFLVAGRLWVFLVGVAALAAIECIPWLGTISYGIDGLAPLNLSFLLMPQKLGMYLSAGFI